ncbi:aminoglycoside phosphotransferase family protein [Aestuariimicrobium ganziense]|uniref:aminoglycoside phosphotransferase family protein n=1 Tax=Aestuariimicrobium ganziense TaxID=2773677 RepID=UPI0019414737|nr:aminoglycoside phosphotransferase family protein [Aestuariimicrobium ganziense]
MDEDVSAFLSWVEVSFPGHGWSTDRVREGAFHEVALCEHFALRAPRGDRRHARAAREAASLWSLQQVRFSFDVPRLRSDVTAGSTGRAGYLTTLVPGNHEPDLGWDALRDGYLRVLDELTHVLVDDLALPPVRAWCGGGRFPQVVNEHLLPLLPLQVRAPAKRLVRDLLALRRPEHRTLVHGDFGHHNLLWEGPTPVSLIDLDHVCIDDPAIDVAPLVGQYGTKALSGDFDDETLARAMTHRATLSLQVAAAAELAGLTALRDHALQSVVSRHTEGTLHDPDGAHP